MLAEVAVEGEGVGDGFFTHDDETAGVDEADGLATGTEHVCFSDGELGFGDVVEVDHGQIIFGEFLDGGEAEAILEQGPRFETHVVRRGKGGATIHELGPNPRGAHVFVLFLVEEANQRGRIDENYHDLSSPRYLSWFNARSFTPE